MESGLLYAAVMLVLLIVYSVGSNGAYPLTDAVPQIIGIAFDLIIIRASTHIEGNYTTAPATAGPTFAVSIGPNSESDTAASYDRGLATRAESDDHDLEFRVPGRGVNNWDREVNSDKMELRIVRPYS
ncbi:hypothetical protein GYMLUDRAFT_64979 [Collybiopsis luxurians FD-317 M1]|uniref:Uncharacterized protein n=1 Tax=Collybiopsis luxurians FD-317 M1 TaxID=944289 RepID=A0A0D0ALP5_9AGAR|nr:hypothetical protein GYMLUDRAFT_64979 [Collybiopsis luxurians FD-317 M1]